MSEPLPRPRFVFDTNALLSALLFERSVPGQAVFAGLARGDVLVSDETADELARVLGRPKFDRYVTGEERDRFLNAFLRRALLIDVAEPVVACRDPKDDKFLSLAQAGEASALVTGDADLLVLHPFEGVPIVTPRAFLDAFAPG